jgi:hypothetical protein
MNAAMLMERAKHIGAGPHERVEARNGHANGFKPRSFHTSMGALKLATPQKGDIPVAAWVETAPLDIRQECFTARSWQRGLTDEEKEAITARIWEPLDAAGRKALDDQRRRPVPDRDAYDAMPYAERITHCERPENIAGPSPAAWADINAHLGTSANSLLTWASRDTPRHLMGLRDSG